MDHLRLPKNQQNDESSDFIQFKRTADDVVDGATLSRTESHIDSESDRKNKAIIKPGALNEKNQPSEDFRKTNLKFNKSQSPLKLKWATLYIQMAFRPLTLRAWLDERNKHDDFNEFYRNFVLRSVEDLDRSVMVDEDATTSKAVTTINNDRVVRRRASSISAALEGNLSKPFNSLDVTMNIFLQTLSGLRYIHLENIVHHDIKPSNIFIGCEKNGDLYVQLGDFGLACPLQAKHSRDAMIGTLTYAAPEQLRGHCNPKVR